MHNIDTELKQIKTEYSGKIQIHRKKNFKLNKKFKHSPLKIFLLTIMFCKAPISSEV